MFDKDNQNIWNRYILKEHYQGKELQERLTEFAPLIKQKIKPVIQDFNKINVIKKTYFLPHENKMKMEFDAFLKSLETQIKIANNIGMTGKYNNNLDTLIVYDVTGWRSETHGELNECLDRISEFFDYIRHWFGDDAGWEEDNLGNDDDDFDVDYDNE